MKRHLLFSLTIFIFTSFIFSQTIQWQQLNGPFGGTALSFVSNSNGDIFAGADQDQRGIFRSTDGGITWQPKNTGLYLDNRAFNWLVVDDSSYIIAGTGSHIGNIVYKSKDDGESWTQIAILGGTSVSVNDSGHIYVGDTGYGKYSVSKDAGYTWTHYSHPSPFIYCIEINDSGHIFIGGNYTGYRSTDNGTSWTNLSLPDGIKSFAFAPNGDVYAGCSRENASNSGVYKSTDNGDSWTPVKEGFRVYPNKNIVINNAGDILVGSYGWGIWRSTDDGTTWTQQNSGLGHIYIKSMYIAENGFVYAGTIGGGIYRSIDNGESWQQVGLTSAYVKALEISPSNGFLFASTAGMSRSTDSGLIWTTINNGLSASDIKIIAIKSDGTIFAGCGISNWAYPNPCIYRSTDDGNSWSVIENGIQRHDVQGISIDGAGNVYASNYYGVYKSTNNGDFWFKIGDPLGAGKLAFNSLGDLFVAGNGIWKLPAGDSVWVQLSSGGYWTFYCGSNDYLYTEANRSTDNGLTWTSMPIGNAAYSYAENSVGHLFAGTFNFGSGVKRSTDYGETWESINSGIPTNDVRSVAVDADDYLYAGPWGYSLFKTTTSTLTSVEDERNTPTLFSLEQNYPNPFNPNTLIKYSIPKSSQVTLKIFNTLGEEIEIIVNEERPVGVYEVNWNAANFPSGVYFYRLQAGDFVQTRKMILLK
jgi:photosystem II stability/assembly factor-like uncharacterized protein